MTHIYPAFLLTLIITDVHALHIQLYLSKLSKVFKIVKSFQNCQKLLKLSKTNSKLLTGWSGHVSSSLWSNVSKVTGLSRVGLCMSKSKGHSLTHSVTRSPIELFWKAKATPQPKYQGSVFHFLYLVPPPNFTPGDDHCFLDAIE